MRKTSWLFGILGIASMAASAQTSLCERITGQIDSDIKALAEQTPAGDTGAPHETNRLLRISNAAALIQSNLTLLQANKCRLPDAPISDQTYRLNAVECATAEGAGKRLAACNRTNWSKSYKKEPSLADAPPPGPSAPVDPRFDGTGHYFLPRSPDVLVRAAPEAGSPSLRALEPAEMVYVTARSGRYARISKDATPDRWVLFSDLMPKNFN